MHMRSLWACGKDAHVVDLRMLSKVSSVTNFNFNPN